MRLCVVSPHIDDALLSCGIRLQRQKATGDATFIVNIFNKGTNGDNRRLEELGAAAVIGAEAHFLDELDAPDRDARYKSDINLFHGDLANVPADFIAHIASRLADFFALHKIDTAYFPLGAGTHIDHRITFEAARLLEKRKHPVAIHYYEDRPYILWPGVLQGRLYDLGTDARLPAITPEQMMATISDYHYLHHFVPPGDFRDQCLPRYFKALEKPQTPKLHGSETSLTATPQEIEILWQGLACYASQMPFIYPDRETFLRDSQRYEEARSNSSDYIERSWQFTG